MMDRSKLQFQSLVENQALNSAHHPAKPKVLVQIQLLFQFQADQKVTFTEVNHLVHHQHQ